MLLDEILLNKEMEIQTLKVEKIGRTRKIHKLKDYFKEDEINIIAEIKESSPSAGFLRKIDLNEILPVYLKYAKAISVLTDEKFFSGSFERLQSVCEKADIPILCKDFIISKIQIDKAYMCGADIVLLIVRILGREKLEELYTYAKSLGLDVLVEVHSIKEMKEAKNLMPGILGVNSRDLDTLDISLKRAKSILDSVDFETIKIAESGIKDRKDMEYLQRSCDGFLIGEALIKNIKQLRLNVEL